MNCISCEQPLYRRKVVSFVKKYDLFRSTPQPFNDSVRSATSSVHAAAAFGLAAATSAPNGQPVTTNHPKPPHLLSATLLDLRESAMRSSKSWTAQALHAWPGGNLRRLLLRRQCHAAARIRCQTTPARPARRPRPSSVRDCRRPGAKESEKEKAMSRPVASASRRDTTPSRPGRHR